MEKKLIENLKSALEKNKIALEEELKKFAVKDKKLSGDWDTRFPKFNGGTIEEAANEVEEYGNLLSVEYSLETKLKDTDLALEKVKKGQYGTCEKCGGKIGEDRLKISPEARKCSRCK